jgi:hypothetical protein
MEEKDEPPPQEDKDSRDKTNTPQKGKEPQCHWGQSNAVGHGEKPQPWRKDPQGWLKKRRTYVVPPRRTEDPHHGTQLSEKHAKEGTKSRGLSWMLNKHLAGWPEHLERLKEPEGEVCAPWK